MTDTNATDGRDEQMINTSAVASERKVSNTDLMSLRQSTEVSLEYGGIKVKNMLEVMDIAKLMSQSDYAVPKHLRGNMGACFGVTLKALAWRMEPFAVASQTYLVNDNMGYQSQLIHAVIEARAPLKKRLEVSYEGEGDERVCVITGHFRGEDEPRVYHSPPLAKMRPPAGSKKDEEGNPIRKGSPLWDKDPDQQSFYYASRNFARRYCPDVLLGVYTREELVEAGDDAIDITDKADKAKELHERLVSAPKNGEGFHETIVEDTLREGEIEPPVQTAKKRGRPPKQPAAVEEQEQPQPETQSAQPPAARAAKAPTNTAEYRDHLVAWLPRLDNADDVRAHWTAEFKMRRLCQLSVDDAKLFLALVNARCAQLEGK